MVGTVYGIMASLTSPYALIQALMAYWTQPRLTTNDASYLKSPFLMDQPMGNLFLYPLHEPCKLDLPLMAALPSSPSLDGRTGSGTPPQRRPDAPQFHAYHGGMYPDGLCN